MQLIDGKKISDEIKSEIIVETKKFIKENSRKPHLVAVLVGEDGGSVSYVQNKVKDCEEVGFKSTIIKFDAKVTQKELLKTVFNLNNDIEVDGFIVQLPLPEHISEDEIIDAIDPVKDVDGFNPVNLGRMMAGLPSYTSATPMGIVELLKRSKIETTGKHCVIIGRSNIVGRPLSVLLSQKGIDCTVTLCHSKTKNLKEITKQADIIVAAMGKPEFLTAEMVKEGAVVIDVGTTRVKSEETKSGWKLTGDVKFDEVSKKCSFITPVPGGVGPMTRVALLKNTLLAANGTIY